MLEAAAPQDKGIFPRKAKEFIPSFHLLFLLFGKLHAAE